MATKTRRTTDPLLQRAIDMTKLQFGDQTDAILQAIKDAGAQRVRTIRQARSGARYATDAERYGQKGIKDAYKNIADAAAQSGQFMDKLTPVPDGTPASAILAAIQSSRAAIPTNVATQQAQAITDSEARASRARAGGAFAVNNANANFAGTVADLRAQLAKVQDKAGLSVNTTYQDLLDADSKRRLDEAKFAETQRHNQATEANGAKGKGKTKWLSPKDQNAFNEKVSEAYAWVKRYAADPKMKGKQIRQFIESGGTYVNGQTADGNPKYGNSPTYGSDIARIAMDLYYNVPPGATPGSVRGTLTRTAKGIYRNRRVKPPKDWLG